MVMMMRTLAALVLATVSAACSTTPTAGGGAVPDDRVYLRDLLARQPRDPAKALVIVERDPGLMLGACMFDVFYDGIRLTKIMQGERTAFELPPGRYQFHMEYGGIICPSFASPSYLLEIKAGERATVRMGARTMLGFIQVRKDEPTE